MDILVCSALGADMYDSVYPTRTARFGTALLHGGLLKLRNSSFSRDFRCSGCRTSVREPLALRDA